MKKEIGKETKKKKTGTVVETKSKRKLLLTVVLFLYALFMLFGAVIPNPSDVPVYAGNTKYFHFFGFMVLSFIVFKTFEYYEFNEKSKNVLSFFALLFFIILTEVAQLFVSTRHFAFTDMLIDISGCLIGWLIYFGVSKYFKRNN